MAALLSVILLCGTTIFHTQSIVHVQQKSLARQVYR